MLLVKHHKYKNLDRSYSVISNNDIITMNTTYHYSALRNYWNKIKNDRVENGRYMIKRQQLKYTFKRWDMLAYQKTYFCNSDSAIIYTYDRKDKGIFYLNNRRKILQLCKYLAQGSNMELYSIVDRHNNGKEIYVIDKWRLKSKVNDFLIVK